MRETVTLAEAKKLKKANWKWKYPQHIYHEHSPGKFGIVATNGCVGKDLPAPTIGELIEAVNKKYDGVDIFIGRKSSLVVVWDDKSSGLIALKLEFSHKDLISALVSAWCGGSK